MSGRLVLAARAEGDLFEIGTYIGRDNLAAADRFVDLLREKSQLLADFPGLGAPLRKRRARLYVVGEYLIVYRETRTGITVLRYFHGRRDRRRL